MEGLTREQALEVARQIDQDDAGEHPDPVPVSGTPRFFDPDGDADYRGIVMERFERDGKETFRMRRRIGYEDHQFGALLVPRHPRTFETDLGSVPQMFTWLVPKSGVHLPAVLVHDALVLKEGEAIAHIGAPVPRVDADRILRDATGDLGTSFLRRWLMWAAVATATSWAEPNVTKRVRWRVTIVLTLATIAVLGALATVDVLDVWDVLAWMDDRPWYVELAAGALMAFAIPGALAALFWGEQRRAGFIAGIALAFLLHVTFAIVLVTSLYMLVDTLIERPKSGLTKPILIAIGGIVAAGVAPSVFTLIAVEVGR